CRLRKGVGRKIARESAGLSRDEPFVRRRHSVIQAQLNRSQRRRSGRERSNSDRSDFCGVGMDYDTRQAFPVRITVELIVELADVAECRLRRLASAFAALDSGKIFIELSAAARFERQIV